MMPIFHSTIDLFPVTNKKQCIIAAANTINRSFSRDPLIQWLRPKGLAWECLDNRTSKWQYRRLQQALSQGFVMQSACVENMREQITGLSLSLEEVDEGTAAQDSGAVVMLFPPKEHLKWDMKRFIIACKVWFLDWIDPAIDHATDELRLKKLMAAHDVGLEKVKKQYRDSLVWYLEVIAIHPLLQSCGLGKKVMQQVFNYVNGECIALECTSERNIPFYLRLGFNIVEEVELTGASESSSGERDTVKYWLMVRDGDNSRKGEQM